MTRHPRTIATICLTAAWMMAAQAAVAQGKPESREVEFFYSELNDDPGTAERCEGSGLVGNTECVAKNMDPDRSGAGTTSAEASLNLTLTPRLRILKADNSHIVTIRVRGGGPVILGRMKAQSQNDVWADTTLVKQRLRAWRLSLSEAQIDALYRDGSLTFQIKRPFENLKRLKALDTPVALAVAVRCPEPPDFNSLMTLAATEREKANRRLRENFGPGRSASCPSQSGHKEIPLPASRFAYGFGTVVEKLRASLLSSAAAQERAPAASPRPEVTAESGPFAGMKFGQYKSDKTFPFRNRKRIRAIQAEMTRNGGRDETLQKNGWHKFEADVARTVEALNKYTDTMQSRSYVSLSIEAISKTQSTLSDRRAELEALRDEVTDRLRDPKFKEFLEALESRISRDRAKNPHDPSLALAALAVRNLIKFLVKGSAAANPIMLPLTLYCLGSNLFTILTVWDEDRKIKTLSGPYLELMDMSANLTLLIEQYNMRMEAQQKLLAKLNAAWDRAKKRQRGCKK